MQSFGTLVRFIWRSSRRAAVFVVGVALLAVGLVMFVTPGPGIVLVVAGLAILATEFAWAEHLLAQARRQAARAGQASQRVPGVARVTTVVVTSYRWVRRRPAADPGTGAGPADEPADTATP
ncbi:MAG TPA: PGPGW domain-containing protein [Acidimicrobiales bacterium]|nr:PGPGW domain-containing protein [Acidimicrobiales bacterium]